MDKNTAFGIITQLAELAQKSGNLTLGDAVQVNSMLQFVSDEFTETEVQTADEPILGDRPEDRG